MHRLLVRALAIAAVIRASPGAAQPVPALPAVAPAPVRPDSAVRRAVAEGLVRVLAASVGAAVFDATPQPWRLFPDDTAHLWTRERAGLARALRARPPRADDRFAATVPVPDLTQRGDTVRVSFEIVYHQHCAGGWTSRGTYYTLVLAPGRPAWQPVEPAVGTMWDGAGCRQVDRVPGLGEPTPLGVQAGAGPRAP